MFSKHLHRLLATASLAMAPLASQAQIVSELGDAGETLATAQVITGPVSQIQGNLQNLATDGSFFHDIDLYRITILNPAAFGVTVESHLEPFPGWQGYDIDDTMLFLFDAAGKQIKYVDDVNAQVVPFFTPGEFAGLAPGDYYLGFDLFGSHSVLDREGYLEDWIRMSVYEMGPYTLFITGAGGGQAEIDLPSAVPEPATWALMILGFGAAGAALRQSQRRARSAALPA